MYLSEIARAVGGRLIGRDERVRGFFHDSRNPINGGLFIAIRGEKFDGHRFVGEALYKGAVGALVSRVPQGVSGNFVLVEDTLEALRRLAIHYRENYLTETRIIAIGGAAGKTTTKEMLHRVLSSRYRSHRSPKSFNNHIGVPLTLLNTPQDTEILIAEVGTNHPGEVKSLVNILRNEYGLLTNIGPEHIEFFGSLEAIAREESHVFLHARVGFMRRKDYEIFSNAMILPEEIHFPRSLEEALKEARRMDIGVLYRGIRFPNVAWLENALLVEVVGRHFGIEEPLNHLRDFRSESMRMEILERNGMTIINDAYNSNPLSLEALFMSVKPSGENLFVLGDMLELGDFSERYHREMGRKFLEYSHRHTILIGDYMRYFYEEIRGREGVFAEHFPSVEKAIPRIKEILPRYRRLILKGSRGIGLERILNHI